MGLAWVAHLHVFFDLNGAHRVELALGLINRDDDMITKESNTDARRE